jgi:hypothetical protein
VTDLTLNELKYLSKVKTKEALDMERKIILGFLPELSVTRNERKRSFIKYLAIKILRNIRPV